MSGLSKGEGSYIGACPKIGDLLIPVLTVILLFPWLVFIVRTATGRLESVLSALDKLLAVHAQIREKKLTQLPISTNSAMSFLCKKKVATSESPVFLRMPSGSVSVGLQAWGFKLIIFTKFSDNENKLCQKS